MTSENPLKHHSNEEIYFARKNKEALDKLKVAAIAKLLPQLLGTDGVIGVGSADVGINVIVTSLEAAESVPTNYDGYQVTTILRLENAGDKVILRDGDGKVIGVQG